MICTAHRLQCKTQHFPKHKFPVHATRNVQNAPEINCSSDLEGVQCNVVNPLKNELIFRNKLSHVTTIYSTHAPEV